ncbi:MAG TPA: glycosyltransferase family 2 protein [Candidatus Acidoferrum sp.]|nr:glycosyltransferase family 2 protein [Candidatus Acidoferrum sp.]
MRKRAYQPPQLQRLDFAGRWLRISLVTAVRNGAKYLEATIQSIINQHYPNLEYIVIDGGSSDGTLDIIKKYESHISCWISEPDPGLYDALNKGFARSTGEIMGWLNASDMLQINGLFVVGSVLGAFPQIEWITGRPTKYSPSGMTVNIFPTPHWSRLRFLAGANKYIQQESTYWRRSLWEKAGGALSTAYRAEGDFELWIRFFRHAQLYTVDALIGGYRTHPDALSSSDIHRYNRTCDEIASREVQTAPWGAALRLFRWVSRTVKPIPKVRGLWHRLAIKGLYRIPGPDWPPVVVEADEGWRLSARH